MRARSLLAVLAMSTVLLASACTASPTVTPRATGGWQTQGHRDPAAMSPQPSTPETSSTAGTSASSSIPTTSEASVGPDGMLVVGCDPKPDALCAKASVINADWSGLDLTGIDLTSATLLNTNLSGANLTRAKLGKATIMNVNLAGASLRGADLNGALLVNTGLTSATTGPKTTCPNGASGPCS